jgi:hypothetical protein
MSTTTTIRTEAGQSAQTETGEIELEVRGRIPPILAGSLIVATSRRHKDRHRFSRWHDSPSDLLRLDLYPGRPGRVRARFLSIDPEVERLAPGYQPPGFYPTRPNHGINIEGSTVWATNLLFGAPLEVDLETWTPRRILRYLEPTDRQPQVTSTSHFAWSLNGRYAYFHQSLLERETGDRNVHAADLSLVEVDARTGAERIWTITPPPDDASLESANFHSAFYYEEGGKRFVGLLKTGAIVECLEAHTVPCEHAVSRMPPSAIWILELDHDRDALSATLLPEIAGLGGLALSHLTVDASSGDGFILYANYKQADVGEETRGENIYGEKPEQVREHYAGMIVEALNFGKVLRYERQGDRRSLRTFSRPYMHGRASLGHSWLPINLSTDYTGRRLFGSFSGFRPRLLPRRVAEVYPDLVVDSQGIRYVPPLLMRFDAETLEPDYDADRRHLSYGEPVAMAVAGDGQQDYVCTFSPELGLRIYHTDDLSRTVGHAISHSLLTWKETHFRPEPAHMEFVRR